MAYARMSDVTMKLNGPGSATTYTHTHTHTQRPAPIIQSLWCARAPHGRPHKCDFRLVNGDTVGRSGNGAHLSSPGDRPTNDIQVLVMRFFVCVCAFECRVCCSCVFRLERRRRGVRKVRVRYTRSAGWLETTTQYTWSA